MTGTQISTILEIPDDSHLGPAMRKLTPRRRAFVLAALVTGEQKFTNLAKMAGFQGSDETLRAYGHKLAHSDDIIEASREESQRRMQSATIMATSQLVSIAADAGRKDQLKAIEMILNRTGLHAITESHAVVEHKSSNASTVKQIVDMCQKLGIDPRKLLGSAGVVIDAEFTVVEPKSDSADPKLLQIEVADEPAQGPVDIKENPEW